MQSLNILIAGDGKSLKYIWGSKLVKKLYIVSDNQFQGVTNIKFNTFRELAFKCKSLQIDIVLVENEKWILQGIADVLRKHFINCVAPYSHWAKLSISGLEAKRMITKYGITAPETMAFPKSFPLMVRANGFSKIAHTVQEVLKIRGEIQACSAELAKTAYLEEYIEGKETKIVSIYDGKNVLSFNNLELSAEQIKMYAQSLQEMLNSEKADFIGFITTNVIIREEKIYTTGFRVEFPDFDSNVDLIYILISAIYQKLDEIELFA